VRVDKKSQIPALNRSQPLLSMRPGQPARLSHDYKRYGTSSLIRVCFESHGTDPRSTK
jgi:hypothetical protein